MADQRCSIEKQVFEISLASKENVHQLQNRISRLANDRLSARMEAYFNEVIPENQLLLIDQLSVDIGEVKWDDLEEEIEEKFMKALETELSAKLLQLSRPGAYGTSPARSTSLLAGKSDLLEHFLLTGTLPWWSRSFSGTSMETLVEDLFRNDAAKLKALILRIGEQEHVRQRIVYQFNEDTIKTIIKAVEQTEAAYIFQSQLDIAAVQKKEQVVKAGEQEFRDATWLFILNYLLTDQGSEFSRKLFIKSNLSQIATRYNASYHDILLVFYNALNNVENKHEYESLQKFIREIFMEDPELVSQAYDAGKKPLAFRGSRHGKMVNTELLEYFLAFGTLPYEFEQTDSKTLMHIFLETARAKPGALRKAMYKRNQSYLTNDQLYQILGTQGLKELTALLFPIEGSMISSVLGSIQSLQHTYPFISKENNELHAAMWQVVFDTLMMPSANSFSETTFIHLLIDGLETKFGTRHFQIWRSIHESLSHIATGTESSSTARIAQVVKAAVAVAQTNDEPGRRSLPAFIQLDEDAETSVVAKKARLNDMVRYLLQYGNLPWWGQNFYQQPLQDMISELARTDRQAMLLIFRQSMQQPVMKERLFSSISAATAADITSLLPSGEELNNAVNGFFELLQHAGLLKYHQEDFIRKLLYSAAWNLLSSTGYTLFSTAAFFMEATILFSGILQKEPAMLVSEMMQAWEQQDSLQQTNEQAGRFVYAAGLFNRQWVTTYSGTRSIAPGNDSAILQSEDATAAETLPHSVAMEKIFLDAAIAAADVAVRITDILLYFITWNRMPDEFRDLGQKEKEVLLKEMLVFIFRHRPEELDKLFGLSTASPLAPVYLVELLAGYNNGIEKELFLFISQRSLDMIIRQQGNSFPGFVQKEIYTGEEEQSVDLETFFLEETAAKEQIPVHEILKHSLQLLEYFLQFNKLPEGTGVSDEWKINSLLKEMLTWLFRNDPGHIKRLFERPGLSVQAKLRLYDLFVTGTDIITSQLAAEFDKARETDFIGYFLEAAELSHISDKESIGVLMDNYFQHEAIAKREERIAWLLSSPSFAKIILEKNGIVSLLRIAEYKIRTSTPGSSIMEIWWVMISRGISSSLERERITELFKRFNINFISGYGTISTGDEYSTAFLRFLALHTGTSFASLMKAFFSFALMQQQELNSMQKGVGEKLLQLLRQAINRQEEAHFVMQANAEKKEQQLSAIFKEDAVLFKAAKEEQLHEDKEPEKKKKEAMDNKLAGDEKNGFYINNAGLVLFHPFLQTYFSRVGLMQGVKFINDESRNRAVLLLQYLADGLTEHEEHELLLNKILCNVPITEPVPVKFVPTQLEIDTTAELFSVFIQRWTKMKNSTVEGIRSSFLVRNAVIRMTEDGWNMRVEQRSFDIILQTLPWAYGFIKTGWMDKILYTEWI